MSTAKQVTIDHAEKLAEALEPFAWIAEQYGVQFKDAHVVYMHLSDLRRARDALAAYRASITSLPPAIGPERDAE